MFRKFFEFVGESTKQDIRSVDEFLEYCSGKSFLNGLYRIHNTADIPKWNDIAGRAFPEFAGIIKVFGYDWLGRHFAVDSRDNTILLLEPGTGEVLGFRQILWIFIIQKLQSFLMIVWQQASFRMV